MANLLLDAPVALYGADALVLLAFAVVIAGATAYERRRNDSG